MSNEHKYGFGICPDDSKPESEPPVRVQPDGSVAEAIVDAIRELDRHIENQRWSSNCKAIADRERLVTALIDMGSH